MSIDILYPNGQVLGAQVFIDSVAGPIKWDGTIVVSAAPPSPVTSGGTSCYHKVSAGNNNADVIKASKGQIYGVQIYNNASYPIYVKFYNKITAPNPASDTVIRSVGVQAGVSQYIPIQFGLPFSLGIGIAIVKGITDTDNTPVLANDCTADIDYE